MKKINQELRYPDQLTEGGKVFIQFTIDTTGNSVDVKVIKGLNAVANEEALRAFKVVNEKFEPATQREKVVPVRMILPITFGSERVRNKHKIN